MTGSKKWFNYTGDGGTLYAVERDESNSEATSGGAALLQALTATAVLLPGRLQPRYVNAVLSTNPLQKKRFIVGTQAIYNAIGANATITEAGTPALVWNVTSKRGEQSTIPSGVDTGLTDGDN